MTDNDNDPILIRGAREHNLKNVSLDIPSQRLVVVTGPSGSGKSSLAFDTLFAEGQRRYMESLSAYARQFMEQLAKPEVDFIDGLSPAIAIEQKTISSHPRSTVGTVTSIYDFVRLLYARAGEVRDPESGASLKAVDEKDIVRALLKNPATTKLQLFASVARGKKGEFLREFEQWRRMGFTKVRIDGKLHDLFDPILISRNQHHDIDVLLDSLVLGKKDDEQRILDALKVCDKVSEGWLRAAIKDDPDEKLFGKRIALPSSGRSFPELEPRLFSFNSPYGMCKPCKGLGFVEKLVDLKLARSRRMSEEEEDDAEADDIEQMETCPDCKGARLNTDAMSVYLHGKNVVEFSDMSSTELLAFIDDAVSKLESPVAHRLLAEIRERILFLENVGVGYLTLSRRAATLSGGEAQRIRLATQLGTQLSGVLYVLDEPSIGLHPRDHQKLLGSLKGLRDLGNSVVVVEHDEDTMLAADHLIEVGPGAGIHGGQIIAQGSPKDLIAGRKCLSAAYLSGEKLVSPHRYRRPGNGKFIRLTGCTGHNLKNVDFELQLGKFIVVTGVSGSGKSSLVRHTLETALAQKLYRSSVEPLPYKKIEGIELIDKLVNVDQRPIGRSPRSNPATYTGLFSSIRALFAQSPDAQIRGYGPGTFSFNVKGGRCDACEGAGRKKIEMHFLADVYVPCETCLGARYRREVLEVRFKGKNIADVLNLSIEEAVEIFQNQPLIEPRLRTLNEVGLGYIKLGQAATTLSGGEAQRIKLAKELSKKSTGKTLYFLDEPTTGLHFEDVRKLLELCQRLCDLGNTVVVIEHNTDVICAADWLVEMGPGAGVLGGELVFEGIPEAIGLLPDSESATGPFVHEYFERRHWTLKPIAAP
jgi:excinuclease ABC subunit A